eukprot:8221311-Karenia_brevis.AAC.1
MHRQSSLTFLMTMTRIWHMHRQYSLMQVARQISHCPRRAHHQYSLMLVHRQNCQLTRAGKIVTLWSIRPAMHHQYFLM